MPQRTGILRVVNDGTTIHAEAGGQLTPQEWVFALEMIKSRILAQAGKEITLGVMPRKIDRGQEVQ